MNMKPDRIGRRLIQVGNQKQKGKILLCFLNQKQKGKNKKKWMEQIRETVVKKGKTIEELNVAAWHSKKWKTWVQNSDLSFDSWKHTWNREYEEDCKASDSVDYKTSLEKQKTLWLGASIFRIDNQKRES